MGYLADRTKKFREGNEETKIESRLGVFLITMHPHNLELGIADEELKEQLNLLYPDSIELIGGMFSFEVEKMINQSPLPCTHETMYQLEGLLRKLINKQPLHLRQMLLGII